MTIAESKEYSIASYLQRKGIELEDRGDFLLCRSPFTRDTSPSFSIYNSRWKCYSTGRSGDLLDLIQYFEGCRLPEALEYIETHRLEKAPPLIEKGKKRKIFNYHNYINYEEKSVRSTHSYALNRSISSGYLPAVFTSVKGEQYVRIPALMFLHVDERMQICGAKFRGIGPEKIISSRGKQGFYILESPRRKHYHQNEVWLVESETSANSLWEYFKEIGKYATVISMGGVANIPKCLPRIYEGLPLYLIIDYDGDNDLYTKRLQQYEHLKATPITLILEKGQDINSLYHNKQMHLIEHLFYTKQR
jgi:DNA primase